jgi:hypothetical protein
MIYEAEYQLKGERLEQNKVKALATKCEIGPSECVAETGGSMHYTVSFETGIHTK